MSIQTENIDCNRKERMLEFFAYEQMGACIGHASGTIRADFGDGPRFRIRFRKLRPCEPVLMTPPKEGVNFP